MIELKSQMDASVNFVEENLKGFIEARYVRREDGYFNCYLSSQSGCNKGCRFCHLTATKQTQFEDVTPDGFLKQAEDVFKHYRGENKPAKFVHYSFMARGEALANKFLLADADKILLPLCELAVHEGLNPKVNISTIMPKTLDKPLTDVFKIVTPTIYYSMYSANHKFREKWLPAAMPVHTALAMLAEYQQATKKIVKIHYAFIKGENDSLEDIEHVINFVECHQLQIEFNIVRYNPFSPEQGEESDEETVQRNFGYLKGRLPGKVRLIKRVGFDVKASCGMFVE
jgi:adenine C2-methylase RlmN of 23S rRNA A2503 and tRNA A37